METKLLPNNVIRIPCDPNTFFIWWFRFLTPFHKATPKEIEVAAAFVRKRFELSKGIIDVNLLDKIVMLEDTKREIRENLKINAPHFQVIMSKLKKCKIIENDRINPRFIPKLDGDINNFQLLFLFQNNDNKTNNSESSK